LLRASADSPTARHRLRTVYFDTPELSLARAGFTLRVRQSGNRFVQTVQGVAGPLAESRTQVEGPVPSLQPDLERIPGAKLRLHLTQIANAAPQKPLVEIESLRSEQRIQTPRAELRLSLDEGQLRTSRGALPIAEARLELVRGHPQELYDFALELQQVALVRISTRSALERGLSQLTGAAPLAQRARRTELPKDATLEQALEAISKTCFEQILANEEPARLGLDPESVHQMRVGVRRLRSAISLFKKSLPVLQRRSLQQELRWLARELGHARDLDVLIAETLDPLRQRFPDDRGIKHLTDVAGELRNEAYDALRITLDSRRYAELMLHVGSWITGRGWREQPLTPDAAALFLPARTRAVDLLRRRRRKVRRVGRHFAKADAAELHQLRIEAKKLRYATEFLMPLFSGKQPRRFVRATSRLQETLGHLNDTATASRLLDELLARLDEEARPACLRSVGFVEGWVSRSSESHLANLRGVWRKFDRTKPFSWRIDSPPDDRDQRAAQAPCRRGEGGRAHPRQPSLSESRAVVARVQPSRPRDGQGCFASAARADQVPRHLEQQPR
jgi:inorganic triphosphatase YgiF